ncbi:unnamed protein product [Amoebophrya sp. A25]|nr:unnamed protein product [Amoebophrya sp. A25]|eukprot:GSA25T00010064001.1
MTADTNEVGYEAIEPKDEEVLFAYITGIQKASKTAQRADMNNMLEIHMKQYEERLRSTIRKKIDAFQSKDWKTWCDVEGLDHGRFMQMLQQKLSVEWNEVFQESVDRTKDIRHRILTQYEAMHSEQVSQVLNREENWPKILYEPPQAQAAPLVENSCSTARQLVTEALEEIEKTSDITDSEMKTATMGQQHGDHTGTGTRPRGIIPHVSNRMTMSILPQSVAPFLVGGVESPTPGTLSLHTIFDPIAWKTTADYYRREHYRRSQHRDDGHEDRVHDLLGGDHVLHEDSVSGAARKGQESAPAGVQKEIERKMTSCMEASPASATGGAEQGSPISSFSTTRTETGALQQHSIDARGFLGEHLHIGDTVSQLVKKLAFCAATGNGTFNQRRHKSPIASTKAVRKMSAAQREAHDLVRAQTASRGGIKVSRSTKTARTPPLDQTAYVINGATNGGIALVFSSAVSENWA